MIKWSFLRVYWTLYSLTCLYIVLFNGLRDGLKVDINQAAECDRATPSTNVVMLISVKSAKGLLSEDEQRALNHYNLSDLLLFLCRYWFVSWLCFPKFLWQKSVAHTHKHTHTWAEFEHSLITKWWLVLNHNETRAHRHNFFWNRLKHFCERRLIVTSGRTTGLQLND